MPRPVTPGTAGLDARVAFRCTAEEKQKLRLLGSGRWIREQLQRARKPRTKNKV